jgi:DNA (cytosine-5)-methyltransferase 1
MTFGSLFSGIGGMDLGLTRAGMVCRWQCEIDPYACRVLAKHWPEVTRYGDIRDLDDRLERVDLIAGGFPCQPVSLAGKRRGRDDPRWLWPEFARIVRLVRPRFVLVENAAGLASLGLGAVLGDLSALGYDAEWSVVSACAMGAAHSRERLFLVAYANRDGGAAPLRLPSRAPGRSGWSEPLLRHSRSRARNRRETDQSPVRRVADGVPDQLERLRGLGNAVVPQVAEWVGRRIMAAALGGVPWLCSSSAT